MVSLSTVLASNALISSTFPTGLVALFVGATAGIGEATLKAFAKHTFKPRAYLIGRSQESADRIVQECKELNPEGEYHFIKADVSLIHVVDEVCEDIKAKEKYLNILFMSAGVPSMDRSKTEEGIHLLAALNYYSRMRFATNLLPIMKQAPYLRRIITVGGGGYEGPLDSTDFPALLVPFSEIRGHLCSLVTLGFEAISKTAPEVAFIHDYPGMVLTKLTREHLKNISEEEKRMFQSVEIGECGERQLYLATSERFVSKDGKSGGVELGEGVGIAIGSEGGVGSGMYSVGWDGESAGKEVLELLAGLREEGMAEEVWKHTDGEFKRVTGE